MYKLLINKTNVYEGGSLTTLILSYLIPTIKHGDTFEIYRKKRTQWELEDGATWLLPTPTQ